MFFKIGVLKNFAIFKGWPATLLRKDSNTGVFQWILQNSLEKPFYRRISVAASVDKKLRNDMVNLKGSHSEIKLS